MELDEDLILVLTLNSMYHVIDLKKRKVKNLGSGYGEIGLSLTLLPNFDINDYPYVLCKEYGVISILDPIHNRMSSIVKFSSFWELDQSNISEDNVIFDSRDLNNFYTNIQT